MDPQHFKNGLLHGDPGIIYPVLGWMLNKSPELTTRAYLARFLVSIEIPEHLFGDEEILEVYQQYKDLQDEFKEVYLYAYIHTCMHPCMLLRYFSIFLCMYCINACMYVCMYTSIYLYI